MGLTLDDLSRRVNEIAPHPTGAGRQTTKRIVRLTLCAISEHLAGIGGGRSSGWDPERALTELLDACQRAEASIVRKDKKRRRALQHSKAVQNAV